MDVKNEEMRDDIDWRLEIGDWRLEIGDWRSGRFGHKCNKLKLQTIVKESIRSKKMITANKIHLCWCAIILLVGYEGSLAFPQSYRTGHSRKSVHLKQNRRLGDFLKRRAVLSNTSESSNEWSDCNDERGLKKFLRKEFITIALPALIQLTAEPLASLVDTAYLGRLGPEVLGGAGVAISAQYTFSKLYNDPLLRTSISLVATQDGKARSSGNESYSTNESSKNNDMSIAVSSALLLALCIGLIQAVIYYGFASGIIGAMGVSSTGKSSLMYQPAVSYLKIRALGTPAATLWLVTNGIYRGMGDTITPLVYSLFFTATNAILDPFFIFTLNFGASGAAAGTAIAQYLAVIPLMLKLNEKVKIDIIGQLSELKGTLQEYLKAGAFVFTRTLGKVLAYAVCAKEAVSCGKMNVIIIFYLTFNFETKGATWASCSCSI